MTFAHPALLPLGALLVALLLWLLHRAAARRDAQTLRYSNLAFVLGAAAAPVWPVRALAASAVGGIVLLGFSVAGPRIAAAVPVRNATVVLCLDTSGSMRARDLQPSRRDAALAAARAFIDAVPDGTRLGIVAFSSAAQVILPPSGDLDAARAALERVPPADGGTAIGDALETAAGEMPAAGARAIVLMTDGVNNRGTDPLEAARSVGARGIRIWTVGIGTAGSGEIIPGTNELADLDEEALRAIAGSGGGTYAHVVDAASLVATFRNLAAQTVWERKRVEIAFPLALGGGTLLALALLAGVGLGRIP